MKSGLEINIDRLHKIFSAEYDRPSSRVTRIRKFEEKGILIKIEQEGVMTKFRISVPKLQEFGALPNERIISQPREISDISQDREISKHLHRFHRKQTEKLIYKKKRPNSKKPKAEKQPSETKGKIDQKKHVSQHRDISQNREISEVSQHRESFSELRNIEKKASGLGKEDVSQQRETSIYTRQLVCTRKMPYISTTLRNNINMFKNFESTSNVCELFKYFSAKGNIKILYFIKKKGDTYVYELFKFFGFSLGQISRVLSKFVELGLLEQKEKYIFGRKTNVYYFKPKIPPFIANFIELRAEEILEDWEIERINFYERKPYTSYNVEEELEKAMRILSKQLKRYKSFDEIPQRYIKYWCKRCKLTKEELKEKVRLYSKH